MSPAVPRVFIGRQEVALNIRANYLFKQEDAPFVTKKVRELSPIKEFATGVLFVHGIGQQRRAETLSQWSAPLLRWINAWLGGATEDLALKLTKAPLEGWQHGLVLRSRVEYDLDFLDRDRYALALFAKASVATSADLSEHVSRMKELAESISKRRSPTAEELAALALFEKATVATSADLSEHVSRMKELVESISKRRSPTAEELAERDKVVRILNDELHAGAVGGRAEFRQAYVLDVGARSIEPSSVEMHVEAMAGDGYMLRSRWMLAESHWGDSFWAPSFFGFARWCLLTAPILLVHYVAMAKLRHANSYFRWLLAALGIATSITLAQIVFIMLMVLWLVPWERMRSYVLKVQMKLAGVVGDSYILLQDPVQGRAILDRVQRDLDWLLKRCRSVVVIAHSQGAAVAELVLSKLERPATGIVKSFVTLGAGVQTLAAIERMSKHRAFGYTGWAAIGCIVALGVAVAVGLSGSWLGAAIIGAAALLILLLMATRAANIHPGRRTLAPRVARSCPWFDFFATKDLVPYGPLVNADNKVENYHPKEVRNQDSYLSDHVTYWQNPEQVVGALAREIGRAAGFKPLEQLLPDDTEQLNRLERARFSRLGFMKLAGGAMALATALLLYAQWPAWVAVARWALDKLPSLAGAASAPVSMPSFSVWLQALVVLLPLAIQLTLVSAIFEAWTTAELERLLRRAAGSPATNWTVTFTLLLVAVLAFAIDFVWPITPWMMGAAMLVAAVALAWWARRVHIHRVYAKPPAAR